MADSILKDPLGRTVTFHDRTWFGHILKRHPELANHRSLTEGAIGKPIEIRFSTYDPDCRTYYGTGPRNGILIAVVADVVNGFVKTGFLTDRMKGTVEW